MAKRNRRREQNKLDARHRRLSDPANIPLVRDALGKVEILPSGDKLVHLNERGVALLEGQRQRFIEKFGREPGPNDPVFFDDKADTPKLIDLEEHKRIVFEEMKRVGIDPAKAYACAKTGVIPVVGINDHLWSKQDMAEYKAAFEEFQKMS